MRPNRKWKNPRWRLLNLKCTFLHSQTRYQQNSNGYTYIFGDRLFIGTHEKTLRPNRKWKIPTWRPLNLKCMYLQLPGEISTKFQRLYLCFWDSASHWNPWEYLATKPKVAKYKPETPAFWRGVTRARPAIEGKGGSRGGWGPIRHFLNHVKVSGWNEFTIRLIRKFQSKTKD